MLSSVPPLSLFSHQETGRYSLNYDTQEHDSKRRKTAHQLPQNTTISPITPSLLPSYRRLISTSLPIRYPDKFYALSTSEPSESGTIALCAVYTPSTSSSSSTTNGKITASKTGDTSLGQSLQVVAGIQGRLEVLSPRPPNSSPANALPEADGANPPYREPADPVENALYIQTIATAPSYRSLGLASILLDSLITAAQSTFPSASSRIPNLQIVHPSLCPRPTRPLAHPLPSSPPSPSQQTSSDTIMIPRVGLPNREEPLIHSSVDTHGSAETRSAGGKMAVIYVHVWERNLDALVWYVNRGFSKEEKVEGYYRRLKPGGAWMMRRELDETTNGWVVGWKGK